MKWPKSDEKLIFWGDEVQKIYLQLWKKSLMVKKEWWEESASLERLYTPVLNIKNSP